MTKETHTPAPWTACYSLVDRKEVGFHITDEKYGSLHPICEYEPHGKRWVGGRSHPEIRANGLLVAAAPDMLAGLEYAEEVLRKGNPTAVTIKCVTHLQYLISKAKGKS